MKRPRIKMCGLTSVKDALLCAEAGADALGFIFAASKRQVSPQVAREASLLVGPSVGRVGVFMNQSAEEVLQVAQAACMSAVQLHGPLPTRCLEQICAFYPVLRVLSPSEWRQGKILETWPPQVTLMLDAPQPGSGQALDWSALQGSFPLGVWLAGGLGPHNVQQAIQLLRPAGVDAVSHLEAEPGIKNPQAVLAFVDAICRI